MIQSFGGCDVLVIFIFFLSKHLANCVNIQSSLHQISCNTPKKATTLGKHTMTTYTGMMGRCCISCTIYIVQQRNNQGHTEDKGDHTIPLLSQVLKRGSHCSFPRDLGLPSITSSSALPQCRKFSTKPVKYRTPLEIMVCFF